MTVKERVELIKEYADKCARHEIGTVGYDPIDLSNLEHQVKKLREHNENFMNVKTSSEIVTDLFEYFNEIFKPKN